MSVMLADLHHGPTAGGQGLLSAAFDTMATDLLPAVDAVLEQCQHHALTMSAPS